MGAMESSVQVLSGDKDNPTYTFKDDSNSGLFLESSGVVAVSIDGVVVARFSSTGLDIGDGAFTVADMDFSGDDVSWVVDNIAITSDDFVITSNEANAFTVGRQGSTDPVLKVDASTSSVVTGLKITGAATGTAVALAAIGSGTDEHLTLDAKGAGIVTIAGTSTGGVRFGSNATDRVVVKGIYMTPANVAVTIPSYAMDTCDSVTVDVSSALSIQPAVGDAVIAIPQEALPTNCLLVSATVTATDMIQVAFASAEGAGVTGAAKNFKFLVIDLT